MTACKHSLKGVCRKHMNNKCQFLRQNPSTTKCLAQLEYLFSLGLDGNHCLNNRQVKRKPFWHLMQHFAWLATLELT